MPRPKRANQSRRRLPYRRLLLCRRRRRRRNPSIDGLRQRRRPARAERVNQRDGVVLLATGQRLCAGECINMLMMMFTLFVPLERSQMKSQKAK